MEKIRAAEYARGDSGLVIIGRTDARAPLFANMIEGGKTPSPSSNELKELGFKIVVFPLSGLFAATQATEACFRYLKNHGTTAGFKNALSFKEFEELIDVTEYREIEKEFATATQESSSN